MEKIIFKNQKNDVLTGHYFRADGASSCLPIVFATGTGIYQNFYFKFCQWLCDVKKHPVFIFDYNGIGASLTVPIKDSKATIRDWGQYDIPAAIDWLIEKTHAEKVILMGHSVGAQLTGIMPNYEKLSQVIGISASSGFVGQMPRSFRRKALFFFNFYIPISNLLLGYTATKRIRMGENLPREVAKEWAQYCKTDGYIFNAVGKTVFVNYFDNLSCPYTIFYATDDEIATRANVESLLKTFPNAQKKIIEINPVDYGYSQLGHNLFFREKYQSLWPTLYQYI
ncbi:MAG: alpha/beta hydrolase [Neisseriaceae bacterium]